MGFFDDVGNFFSSTLPSVFNGGGNGPGGVGAVGNLGDSINSLANSLGGITQNINTPVHLPLGTQHYTPPSLLE